MPQGHLKGFLSHRSLGTTSRISELVSLGRDLEIYILTSSQVMPMLMVWGPHFTALCLLVTLNPGKGCYGRKTVTAFPFSKSRWWGHWGHRKTCDHFFLGVLDTESRKASHRRGNGGEPQQWWAPKPIFSGLLLRGGWEEMGKIIEPPKGFDGSESSRSHVLCQMKPMGTAKLWRSRCSACWRSWSDYMECLGRQA